jgi:hypothetical protein
MRVTGKGSLDQITYDYVVLFKHSPGPPISSGQKMGSSPVFIPGSPGLLQTKARVNRHHNHQSSRVEVSGQECLPL